jgi:hypothetical protein
MKISKDNFFSVGEDLKIPQGQIEAFWSSLEKFETQPESTPFSKYLFYLGAMIVISAMTWFMSLGWEWFGGGGIFLIATAYALIFTLVGALNWNKKGLRIPSGLLITMAVCMVPLAIYGLETYFNVWPSNYPGKYHDFYNWIKGSWIFMEIGTIIAGAIALWFFPFPFLTAPLFFSVWFLTMDILPLVLSAESTWEQKCWASLFLGLGMIVVGFIVDRKKKEDYGFWSYLFGTFTFWASLNCLVWDKGEFVLFIYLLINIAMMLLSILLRRTVFMVFGALGAFIYLSHLAHEIFQDSIWFPFVLSFIGLAIIYLGVLYQRNMKWIERGLFENLPSGIRSFLDHNEEK